MSRFPLTLRQFPLIVWGLVFCGMAFTMPPTASAGSVPVVDTLRYVVGAGDKFSVQLFQANLAPIFFEISPEGTAIVPTVGSFPIAGMFLYQAKSRLRTALERVFPKASFDISLLAVRTVRTVVTGAVNRPGVYQLLATARVSDAIDSARGLTATASRRNITIQGKDTHRADLLRFWRTGDFESNPELYLGDLIFVPPVGDTANTVAVSGQVYQPVRVETLPSDRIRGLLALAGGVTLLADSAAVSVIFANGAEKKVSLDDTTTILTSGSSIVVGRTSPGSPSGFVTISGEVRSPGAYPFQGGMDLVSLLARAGGATKEAYLPGLTIFNSQSELIDAQKWLGVTFRRDTLHIDTMANYFASNPAVRSAETYDYRSAGLIAVSLVPGDSIVAPAYEGLVTVLGQVANPGRVVFREGMTPLECIQSAGGASSLADVASATLTRRMRGGSSPIGSYRRVLDGDIIIVPRKR